MIAFIGVVLLLFLIPGPAVLLTLSQTMKGGRKAGIQTGVGIAVGDLIHTVAAVLGLSAILMTSALAFQIVKDLGAAYLIYLGMKAFFEKIATDPEQGHGDQRSKPVLSFFQVIVIELLNPKTALFFLAFLPQFVNKGGAPVISQLLTLGLTFVLMSILYTTTLVILVSSIKGKANPFTRIPFFKKYQGKLIGLLFIGLGIKLAFQSQN
jgi:threonine/homoserine/homoserine lactone efflux protein